MIDYAATRQNLKEWIQSPAFDEYLKTTRPQPKWRFVVGGILTLTPVFPLGIWALVSGLRRSKSQKQARLVTKSEAANWEPIACAIVIANSQALTIPGAQAPSVLVGAFDYDDDYFEDLYDFSMEVMALYGAEPGTVAPEHRQVAELINDDIYRPQRRRPVPPNLSRGRALLLFDAIVESNHFPQGQIDSPIVVCASDPLRSGPIIHLPLDLVVMQDKAAGSADAYDPNIIKHTSPVTQPPLVAPAGNSAELLEAHMTRYFGEPETVFHEIISTTVHIDIHFIPASEERPWQTIVTTGMSDLPMTTPAGAEEYRRAELMLRLPPSWPLDEASLRDEPNYFPLRQLKFLARFVHEYETWLCHGHTIPNGAPAEPYAEGIPFSGVLLSHPYWAEEGAAAATLPDGSPVHFWSLSFVHDSEMAFKLENGAEDLLEKLIAQGYGDYLEPRREPCV